MSSANSSLRPAWRNQSGGRGFQPPPSVASERGRSQSISSAGENSGGGGGGGGGERTTTYNKFSALDDDEEGLEAAAAGGPPASVAVPPKGNSRSEALRQGLGSRTSSLGNKGGRRLADLAANAPPPERPRYGGRSTNTTVPVDEGKVIRFTREKLLSMRPANPSPTLPDVLKPLEGNVILSEEPQDPVCWDTFEAEEIWAAVPRRPAKAVPPGTGRSLADMAAEGTAPPPALRPGGPRGRDAGSSAGRWQRGVALPPASAAGDNSTVKARRDRDAENPDDLWDDPMSGAAGDFSAFGDSGGDEEEEDELTAAGEMEPFDFEKMAQESALLEQELHGARSRTPSENTDHDSLGSQTNNGGTTIQAIKKIVDPHRPLATLGTTIRSGSGDDVNVFEDFDEPVSSDGTPSAVDPEGIENAKEDPDTEPLDSAKDEASNHCRNDENSGMDVEASSRLMAMIGVPAPNNSVEPTPEKQPEVVISEPQPPPAPERTAFSGGWGLPASPSAIKGIDGISIPLNPWGGPLLPGAGSLLPGVPSLLHPPRDEPIHSLDLQVRLRQDMEQKAREEEMARRRRQKELDAQKRAAEMQQQQQAAVAAAAAAAASRQQQAGVQNQVELVLMERISTILETSWGRSDLMSILTTLHAEDSRVIALLNSIDALRALIMRHSPRVQLRHDPAFGAEMAILVLTNAQWQQQQQLQQQQQQQQREVLLRARRQQEEEMRRLEQQRLEEERSAAALQKKSMPMIPGAPWFYSDPQQNIQGPFRAEEMRQWFEAGYFKGDLPISQDASGPFRPLRDIYPDLNMAFMTPDSTQHDAAEEEARRRAEELEFERRREEAAARALREAAEMKERERLAREAAEAEQRLRAAERERERMVREQAAQARAAAEARAVAEQSNGGNESSAQLKMLLGLSGQAAPPAPQETGSPEAKREAATKRSAKAKKNSSPKGQQPAPFTVPETAAPFPKQAASVWGAPATPQSSKKTMSEIQQEEARLVAMQTFQRERSGGQTSSGWANVAAAPKTGAAVKAPPPVSTWSASATKPTPVVPTKPGQPVPKPAQTRSQSTGSSRQQVGTVTVANAQMAVTTAKQASGGSTPGDDFGAKMSPALEQWCKEQMMKFNGTEDLTLLSFCMTLKDPNEIRQYLITYLGSSPQVNNFANEFIQRKVGVKPIKQEEWETTAATKKKGKKKPTPTGR